jgi:hypothetical protein
VGRGRESGLRASPHTVIGCDKREAFAQGSAGDEAIQSLALRFLDCFACARNDGYAMNIRAAEAIVSSAPKPMKIFPISEVWSQAVL